MSLVLILSDISNWGEALAGDIIMFLIWLILKLNKDKWANSIAKKQESIDNNK